MSAPIAAVAGVDTGDTAWMLVATALVLMMTPALGLFYAGLVRSKNTLNTFMMCIASIDTASATTRAMTCTTGCSASGRLAPTGARRRPDEL